MKDFVKTEFNERMKDKDRNYLTLSEVLTLEPPEEYPFNFFHIGNVYVLD